MFTSLDVFKTAHAMAVHAGQRQALVAQNVAHADTPGYRALDLPAFSQSYDSTHGARATRYSHLFGAGSGLPPRPDTLEAAETLNGNTVTIEDQMLQAVDVKRQHDRALAIYTSALTVLRGSLGRN